MYQQLPIGAHFPGTYDTYYSFQIPHSSQVFLSVVSDSGSRLYDEHLNVLGRPAYQRPMLLEAGTYVVHVGLSTPRGAVTSYVPSSESYLSLPTLGNGTFKPPSWSNLYKLMLAESGNLFITPGGDSARATIYDENMNFVADVGQGPLFLPAGNYIVLAAYSSPTNASLTVAGPESLFGHPDAYWDLTHHKVLMGDNMFTGRDWLPDVVYGLDGNDVFFGQYDENAVGDRFFGGNGVDTAVYRGSMNEYTITWDWILRDANLKNGPMLPGFKITDSISVRDGVDYLNEVERLQFSDVTLAFDLDGNAGQAYRLYSAAFDRSPEASGLGYWIRQLDHGTDLKDIASYFAASDEFASLFGRNVNDQAFVTALYGNVLDRAPDAGGMAYWVQELADGGSRGDVLASFSESAENQANVAHLIANGIQYEEWLG